MGIGCASKMADSSPAKMKSEQQLGDVSSILQKLKDEVAYLQDEVEAKGAGFYVPLANQLNATRAAMEELTCTLDSCNGGLRSKDADMIPAAVGGAGAVDGESDFGKSIRLIQKSASGARAAYQYASVSAKGLVEDADKLDIVVKACQTEYIKLKLLNNNAKAYVNAKRLKWQTQADCFRYWAEFVHFETIGAIQREMEDLVNDQKSTMERLEEEFEKARAAFDAQMSGQKRIKCMMLLKKMKNSKMQAAFASWCEMVQMIQWERMEAEKAALMAELQARFGHMSAEEIERKMRQFMKRWINRKVIGPFRTWKGLLEAKKQANRAKLKVFLMGKEKAQLMMFFKQWVMVASEKGLMELYEMLDKEEAMRIAAEAELAALVGASGDAGSELNDLQHQIDAENQAATDLFNKANADAADMRRLAKKIRECEADVKQEKEYREEQQAKNLAIREETAATTAVRDELAVELMGVTGDVGNVHNEAQYDE